MKQIKEESVQNLVNILARGKHPDTPWIDINKQIMELEQLKPVEKPKTKGKANGKGTMA